ncbi:hypothetical protein BKA56DRAFT_624102 [Ilyonectria sp. MPI-CAGE-AT-0026]|nr:hypothetical protein BKA56DRAFT_624102 [Ilyonectria sp. MPI-CAGE-AT-0026]
MDRLEVQPSKLGQKPDTIRPCVRLKRRHPLRPPYPNPTNVFDYSYTSASQYQDPPKQFPPGSINHGKVLHTHYGDDYAYAGLRRRCQDYQLESRRVHRRAHISRRALKPVGVILRAASPAMHSSSAASSTSTQSSAATKAVMGTSNLRSRSPAPTRDTIQEPGTCPNPNWTKELLGAGWRSIQSTHASGGQKINM